MEGMPRRSSGSRHRAHAHALSGEPADLRELYSARPKARPPRGPVGGVTKRLFDILAASAALLLLGPLLLVVALLVRLTSRGPALFKQRRGGYRGETFLVLKFRTMTTMDDGRAVAQATRADNRVTPLGAFLRKTSLDELPQLLNVFMGDMSIVGPRPHAVAHDKKFAEVDPDYRLRQRARPGITGLAQVSGCRGLVETDRDVHDRVFYDNDYIDRWSLGLDLIVILRTALLVLNDRQAF